MRLPGRGKFRSDMNKVKRVFRILDRGVSFFLTLILVVVIVLMVPVVLIATGILGTGPTEQRLVDRPGDGALVVDAKLVGRPVAEIVATTAPQSFGIDYQVHVDCTVRNRGASGLVTVSAELTKGGFWQREQMVFIPADETQQVTFAFSEPAFFWGGLNSGSYVCRAKASDKIGLESQSQ